MDFERILSASGFVIGYIYSIDGVNIFAIIDIETITDVSEPIRLVSLTATTPAQARQRILIPLGVNGMSIGEDKVTLYKGKTKIESFVQYTKFLDLRFKTLCKERLNGFFSEVIKGGKELGLDEAYTYAYILLNIEARNYLQLRFFDWENVEKHLLGFNKICLQPDTFRTTLNIIPEFDIRKPIYLPFAAGSHISTIIFENLDKKELLTVKSFDSLGRDAGSHCYPTDYTFIPRSIRDDTNFVVLQTEPLQGRSGCGFMTALAITKSINEGHFIAPPSIVRNISALREAFGQEEDIGLGSCVAINNNNDTAAATTTKKKKRGRKGLESISNNSTNLEEESSENLLIGSSSIIEIPQKKEPYFNNNDNPIPALISLSSITSQKDVSTEEEIKDREEIRTESSITISSLQKLKEETSTLFKEKSKAAQGNKSKAVQEEEIEAMQGENITEIEATEEERSNPISSHVKKLEISREKRSEGKPGERSKKGKSEESSEGELGIGGRNII